MSAERVIDVHLHPNLVPSEALGDGLVVVIDVLRAATSMVFALAAGYRAVFPKASIASARAFAAELPAGRVVLAGERGGRPIRGFELGNSPNEFLQTPSDTKAVVLTTSNGTRAILHAGSAQRVLIGAFVNYSAICEQLAGSSAPVHLLCAGTDGTAALEDALFAGAVVDFLADQGPVALNDSARLAWDAYEHHGQVLIAALELSANGRRLMELGYDADLKAAAQVDRFALVPERHRRPSLHFRASDVHWESDYFSGNSGLF